MSSNLPNVRASEQLQGRGTGGIFLSCFGALWMIAALDQQSLLWLIACDALPASLLLLRSIGLIVAGRRLRAAEPPLTPAETARDRAVGRHFALIFAGEGVAILVAVNILNWTGKSDFLLAAVGIIVGLHFLPLAKLFQLPLYYWTGSLQVALCVATAIACRHHPGALIPLIGLEMALTLWFTVLAVLVRARPLTPPPAI